MQIENLRHPSGQIIPMLVDEAGLPIVGPNEWILSRYQRSENTLRRNLGELSILYGWAAKMGVDIEDRITSGRGFSEAEIAGSLMKELRQDQSHRRVVKAAVSPHVQAQRIATCAAYLGWMSDSLIALAPHLSQRDALQGSKDRLLTFLGNGMPSNPGRAKPAQDRLLSEAQRNFLIAELVKTDEQGGSGLKLAIRRRDRVAIMLMLICGLRIGELLGMKVEDIRFGSLTSVLVQRRPMDANDPRIYRPLVKRQSRILWLDAKFAAIVDDYILHSREVLLAKAREDTEYLIVSDEGAPLSISRMFRICTGLVWAFPGRLPPGLSPHSLRHSFSSDLERSLREGGVEEDRRRRHLALLRGDSSLESQNVYVAAEIEEEARRALLANQRKAVEQAELLNEEPPF
ncbi:MAG: site-specific integrase [Rhodanobacter sp.]|mgnify:CR=1 FL=1|nr:site-specific integrase [Rhodanobacter sp.]ODU92251.1 MAG: hypothetical protein ABT18_13330 [Rhodanobacter sp. SCN 66-43]